MAFALMKSMVSIVIVQQRDILEIYVKIMRMSVKKNQTYVKMEVPVMTRMVAIYANVHRISGVLIASS